MVYLTLQRVHHLHEHVLISLTGSFGTSPQVVRDKQKEYSNLCESSPDLYIRYTYPKLLDKSRAAIAKVLNAPTDTVVFVPNATTGVNTVISNIVWNADGNDEMLYFSTIYGACGNIIEYVAEVHDYKVNPREVHLQYPLSDAALLQLFKDAITASRIAGRRPRLAVYDTISSVPGLRMPFEALTKICKEEGIISVIDGAHGVGHIPLDLTALDPDYFVSNAHKWLHVPRGCAVFYVPVRNQQYIRSTLPTSHGFEVKRPGAKKLNPFPKTGKNAFAATFQFTGTIDNTNYVVVSDAIAWREEVCGGEAAIINQNISLAKSGSLNIARILGTEILDNEEGTLSNCAMVNVRLPIPLGDGEGEVKLKYANKVRDWMGEVLTKEFKTFIHLWEFQGSMWVRMSGQVYLDEEDFEWAGNVLKALCARVLEKSDEFWEGY